MSELRSHFGAQRDAINVLFTLFLEVSGVLHPKHVMVLTANFINPPTVGVAI